MKKFYLNLFIIAASSIAANAQEWVVMQDFEGADAQSAIAMASYDNNPATGELSIKTVATDDKADNRAAYITNKDWSTGIVVSVSLPEGKTVGDYSKVGFDVYNENMSYKPLFLVVNGTMVAEDVNNAIGNQTGWVKFSKNEWEFDLEAVDATATEMKILMAIKANKTNAYAIDNIRLLPKEEGGNQPVIPVEPGEADKSKNGTVTDGWLMAEDFQGKKIDDMVSTYDYLEKNEGSGNAVIIADATKNTNMVAEFTGGNYNTLIEIPVTLPADKTMADYINIAFDLYRYSDDSNYKEIYICADEEVIYYKQGDYIQQAPATVWTEKKYSIDRITSGNTVKIRIGIKSNEAHYAIDNIRLQERPTSDVDFYGTSNGTVADTELMVNDFQHHNLIGKMLPTWSREGGAQGDAVTAADPADPRNIVAKFSGESNYNTIHEIDVELPAGKTLSDYSAVKFELYRNEGDDDYKKMNVNVDGHQVIYTDYINHGKVGEWTTKSYDIPEGHSVGNKFKLRLGIENNHPNYLIDNVRLVEKSISTGIEDVAADDNVNVMVSAGAIVLSGNGRAVIYTLTGQAVSSVEVDGVAEVRLPGGIYVVAFGSHAVKAIVR